MLVLAAAAAILVGVLAAAMGRGGEMTRFPGDFAPLGDRRLRPADLFSLRPPMSLWGYHADAVDDVLAAAARSLAARDAQIASLRSEVASLLAAQPAPPPPPPPSLPSSAPPSERGWPVGGRSESGTAVMPGGKPVGPDRSPAPSAADVDGALGADGYLGQAEGPRGEPVRADAGGDGPESGPPLWDESELPARSRDAE